MSPVRTHLAAALLLSAGLAGCGSAPPAPTPTSAAAPTPTAEPSPVGEPVHTGATVDLLSLAPGQCLARAELEDPAVAELSLLDCAAAHDAEVFAVLTADDGEFPGEEALVARAREYCVAAFESFVGIPWARSRLDFVVLVPDELTWTTADDRLSACVLVTPQYVAGSLSGAAR